MTKERPEERAFRELREAGFPIVQRGVVIPSVGRAVRADLVAWDVARSGGLEPRILVEVKTRKGAVSDWASGVAPQLAAYANGLDARDAYAFDGETWYALDLATRTLSPAARPTPIGRKWSGEAPEKLVRAAVTSEAFRIADQHRSVGTSTHAMPRLIVEGILEPAPESTLGGLLAGSESVARLAVRVLISEILPRIWGRDWYGTPWPLAACMARLLETTPGDTILDPFCGHGTLLWAAASAAPGSPLRGVDISVEAAGIAAMFGRLGRYDCSISVSDSLDDDQARSSRLISNPPFGLKLSREFQLSNGRTTKDGNVAALDRCVSRLEPEGRAVLLVPPALLFGHAGEALRVHLAATARVTAVISLPNGVLSGTSIAPTILVIDRRASSESLLARLGDDWEGQLSEGGEFLAAYRKHVGTNS
jgi:methylase of polypeptide subunit release factors